MNYEQLKNSILQEAIEGRLVPQNPSDEPAAVLLRRIREEKARLVKEKKIKKDKNESTIYRNADGHWMERFEDKKRGEVCIDEEVPFEIPESWEWCRLGSLIDFSKSTSVNSKDIPAHAWILDLEDIEKGTGKVLRKKTKEEADSKSDKHSFKRGNVLYSKLRPYLNKCVVADQDGFCTSEILAFDFGEIYNRYAQIYLMSKFFVSYAMSDAYGVKMPRLGSKQGNAALFPLPPLSEQHRIVSRIEEIMPKVESYGKAQERLDALNAKLPKDLKNSILQEAIEGRLVPQDPSEEPAAVLLQRIREEKARLVKEKKIKKDKNESIIYRNADGHWMERFEDKKRPEVCIDEEIPFEIPETWEWCRLGKIVNTHPGKTPPRGDMRYWSDGKYPWVSISDMKQDGIITDTKEKVSEYAATKAFGNKISKAGSLLMSFKLTIGRTCLLGIDAYHNEAIITIETLCDSNNYTRDYLSKILPVISNWGESKDAIKGSTLNAKSIYNLLIPLPPLSEQHRIVSQLERLLPKVSRLTP
jgi:type I restriction enzyme S subunit